MSDKTDCQQVQQSTKAKAKQAIKVLKWVIKKIEENPELVADLELELKVTEIPSPKRKKPVSKRTKTTPAVIDFDLFEVFYQDGEQVLRDKLAPLEFKTLMQIISNNSFDSVANKKWRNKDSLVNFIAERVAARSRKGQVFMEPR